MSELKVPFAVAILLVWVVVCFDAMRDSSLVPLASTLTPVMLLPSGWLFTDGMFRSLRRRDERIDRHGLERLEGPERAEFYAHGGTDTWLVEEPAETDASE